MDRGSDVARRRPVAFSLVTLVAVLLLMAGAVAGTTAVLGWPAADVRTQVVGQVAGVLAVVLLLWRLGWLAAAGVTRAGSVRVWRITAVALVYSSAAALLGLFGTLDVDLSVASASAPVLVHATLAGVMEELLFRGLVLHALVVGWASRRWGEVASVVTSALLFGLLHLLNSASAGLDVTALQATEALLSAVLYGALVLVGGSVWPAVALHALVNLLVNVAAENVAGLDVTVGEYATFVLLEVPLLVVAAVLLRERRRARGPAPAVAGG